MNKFVGFIKCKWYLLFFMLMLCAAYGSLRGAYKEHERTVWITLDDVSIRGQIDSGNISGEDIPAFIGYIGIANEQNEFYSFKLALACTILGILPSITVMFIYYKTYNLSIVSKIRALFIRNQKEKEIIIRCVQNN